MRVCYVPLAIHTFTYLCKTVFIEHDRARPLDESDISAPLGLIPFPLRGELDPGPRREAKAIGRGVVWL